MPRSPLVPRFQQRPLLSSDLSPERPRDKLNSRSASMAPIISPRWKRRLYPLSALLITFIILFMFLFSGSVTRRDSAAGFPLSRGYESGEPRPAEPVDEIIVVIVPPFAQKFTRESLRTLLDSLAVAHYSRYIQLRLVLGPEADTAKFNSRYNVAMSTQWRHGKLHVVNATSGGLYALPLSAWSPNQGEREHVVIVDALHAKTVDPSWFKYLQAARARYAGVADIAAYAPTRTAVRTRAPVTGLVKHWEPPTMGENDPDDVFLYQSAAYMPIIAPTNAAHWRAFQHWFTSRRSEWF
eukprot:IDg20400t1